MRRFAHLAWLGAIVALGAGCTATHRPPPMTTVAPLEFVAFLCADTCRVEFAGADPLPYHAGAPATRLADGSFEIRYERRADGRWTPRAAGRLVAPRGVAETVPSELRYLPADGLIGWRSVAAELVVRVQRSTRGTEIQATARGFDGAALLRHLQAATGFATALVCTAECGTALRACCAHHAPWRAIAMLRSATEHQRQGHLLLARDLLRSADAVAPDLDLDYRIGALDRALGQDALATSRLRVASRRTGDPGARTLAALTSRDSARRSIGHHGPTLREAAMAQLDAGNLASAEALAHAASAADPDPVADLGLRHRLQRARKDHHGSLATALLLREYGGDTSVDRLLAEDFSAVGNWHLARRAAARLFVGQVPTTELFAALRATSTELAQAAWFGWAEATGTLATPPR